MPTHNNDSSASIEAFASLAASYCARIEAIAAVSQDHLLRELALLLAKLYSSALALPNVEPASEDPLPDGTSEEQIARLFDSLGKALAPHVAYYLYFNPFKSDDQVSGHLADDLTDIYRDLKSGVNEYSKGTPDDVREAVWHWRESFESHWRWHLTGALRAIDWALHGERKD